MIPQVLINPGGTLTGSFPNDPAAIKAAYRLFDCERVTHQAMLAPHAGVVREALALPGTYLLIEDTTSITPASGDASGLGPVDNDGRRFSPAIRATVHSICSGDAASCSHR